MPYEEVIAGLNVLRHDWQLNVIEGHSLNAREGPFAGSDALRRADLQGMFDNTEIRAVFAARGGYGCYRLVDDLDLTELKRNPKWLVGFSDVTVLLSLFYNAGIVSLHGIMPRQFGQPGRTTALESLRGWLFGDIPPDYTTSAHPLNREGVATGPLMGGNLTMLVNAIGTPTDLDYRGAILFIEDIDETLFSLDRMLTQLRRANRLNSLAGLIVGQFTDMRDNASLPYEKNAYELIADTVAGYNFPVLFDFPTGHVDLNLTLPIGRQVRLWVGEGGRVDF